MNSTVFVKNSLVLQKKCSLFIFFSTTLELCEEKRTNVLYNIPKFNNYFFEVIQMKSNREELVVIKNMGCQWSVEREGQSFFVKRNEVVLATVGELETAIKLMLLTASIGTKKIKTLTAKEQELLKQMKVDAKVKECQL